MTTLLQGLRFKHLDLIRHLARENNMHRAAAAMNITQSTASKMLSDIEHLLGQSLFERGSRGMRPTEFGHFALHYAQEELQRLRRFEEEAQARRQGGYGTLVVGAIMGTAPELVAQAVIKTKRQRPRLLIRLLGETSDQMMQMLERARVDLAIGRLTDPSYSHVFSFEPLAEERLLFIARHGHPLTLGQQAHSLATLAKEPWILQPKRTPSRRELDHAFLSNAIAPPEDVVECASIFAMLHLIQHSDAVAVLPQAVVRDHLHSGLLAPVPCTQVLRLPSFGLLQRKDAVLSEAAQAFSGILRSLCAEENPSAADASAPRSGQRPY